LGSSSGTSLPVGVYRAGHTVSLSYLHLAQIYTVQIGLDEGRAVKRGRSPASTTAHDADLHL
jgi:hypothetical protein